MQHSWYQLSSKELADRLKTNLDQGLSSKQAVKREKKLGENKLREQERQSIIGLFLDQFKDFMVIVLLVTTLVSALLGEYVDAVAIFSIVILNAILGFIQEFRAEKSLDALKQLTAPVCNVLRDGKHKVVEAKELVPGDVVLLEAGDRVPADARLLTASSLQVNESALTGESVPAEKDANWQGESEVALPDRENMVFMGTLLTRGKAKAVVVETGMNTEIGKIATMIHDSFEVETPLQRRLAQLGKWLVAACLAIVGLVFVAGVFQGFPIYRMFLTGVSLAVAAIPEGLPAVVTIALAVGVQRMIRRKAIIRQLPAVETLGCATVICSDKTGTLTQNKMSIQKLWLAHGELTKDRDFPKLSRSNHLVRQLLLAGVVCNDSYLDGKDVVGDPTETSLLSAALDANLKVPKILGDYRRVGEVPFDSSRKRMSVCVNHKGNYYSFVKGAPDIILDRCTHIEDSEGIRKLTPYLREEINKSLKNMGDQALRVLALATRSLSAATSSEDMLENNLTFLGLVGMIDPPRPEAKQAIYRARRAGIRTIMVTGDHKQTAAAIAKQLGLTHDEDQVMSGTEWEKLSDRQKQQAVKSVRVFARVAPEHKLSIVRALQSNGEVVGMTGDGVNDAPAVKEADIGISMGETGTDVTKEASAMILADDNFQTIISAIEEGRAIYDNIRKFIRYLLGCNVGEVLTMFFATLAGLPLPLLPIQILWINLVTDGLPAIALGVDPGDTDIMERPPRDANEGIFARKLHWKIGFTGLIIAFCTIAIFVFALWYYQDDLAKARTLAFTTLVVAQLIYVFQCRSEYHSIFEIGFLGNLYLMLAVMVSLSMHLVILYHPWFQEIFRTVALSFDEWLLVFVFSAWTLVLDTVVRMVRNQLNRYISWVKV